MKKENITHLKAKKNKEIFIKFAEWIDYFNYKRNVDGLWSPMELPFLYTTEEILNDFIKDIEDGKIRIN